MVPFVLVLEVEEEGFVGEGETDAGDFVAGGEDLFEDFVGEGADWWGLASAEG